MFAMDAFFGNAGRKRVVALNRLGTRTTGGRRSRRISTKAWRRRGLFRLLMVRTTKYCCAVFARSQRLTDRRLPEAQARQRRTTF